MKQKRRPRFAVMLALVFLFSGISSTTLANQQVVQVVLDGSTIPKFVEPVPTFNGKRADGTQRNLLTVTAEEFQQQILPASFYATLPKSVTYVQNPNNPNNPNPGAPVATINPRKGTYVWGYKVNDGNNTFGPSVPATTIVAKRGIPTKVKYVNNLVPFPGLPGPLLQKFLTVDLSFHWANPLNLSMTIPGTDPSTGLPLGNPAFYGGPQPMTVHLHGAEVPSAFDGGADTWFTPGKTIKGPGFVTGKYNYVNTMKSTTLWYHDHVLGETRLNVYSGLAGFYFLRGDPESDVSPPLPKGPYEVELVIQDRQFDTNGQPFFPDGDPAGAGLNGDPGNPTIHPYWIPEFFGDVIVVNGKSWPFMEVEPRRYRFRFLDACNARMLAMRLVGVDQNGNPDLNSSGPAIWQIGSDGGLLDKPVQMNFTPFTIDPTDPTATPFGSPVITSPRFFIAPAERADVIIDFSGLQGKTFTLVNDGNFPFPGGSPPGPNLDGLIMQFRVNKRLSGSDTSFNPAAPNATLRRGNNKIIRLADGEGGLANGVTVDKTRRLTLIEQEDPDTGAPVKVLLNNTHYDGINPFTGQPIPDSIPFNNGNINVTEIPQIGSTEVWEIVNLTPDAHPIHVHLIQFQVMNRQVYNVGAVVPDNSFPPFFTTPGYRTDAYEAAWGSGGTIYGGGPPLPYLSTSALGGNPNETSSLIGNPLPPDPNEVGWKDTLKMFPGTVTRIVTRWAPQDVEVDDVRAGQNRFAFDPTAQLGHTDKFGFPGGPGYLWHCHILDHEDNDMMRPLQLSNAPQ